MIDRTLKRNYHLVELWALISLVLIVYLSFFQGNAVGLSTAQFTLIIFLSVVFGFGHSLHINWTLVRPLHSMKATPDQLNAIDPEELLSLRSLLYDLPLKRAFWIFERVMISGCCAVILVLIWSDQYYFFRIFLLSLTIFIGGLVSALFAFFSIEKLNRTHHNLLHKFIERKDTPLRLTRSVTIGRRIFWVGTTLILLMMIIFTTFFYAHTIFDPETTSVTSTFLIAHLICALLFYCIISYLLGSAMGKSIAVSIRSLYSSLIQAGRGDLGTRISVQTADELGILSERFNSVLREFSEIFGKVQRVLDSVIAVAETLSSSSIMISESVELQALSTENTSSSMTQMQSSLTEVAESVNYLFGETETTSNSLVEMASSVEEVAENIENLSQSIDSTSTSIEEMNASIKQVAENSLDFNRSALDLSHATDKIIHIINEVEKWAKESSKLSNKVILDADQGHQAVFQTIDGMEKIHKFFQTSGEVIQQLGSRSEQIGNILTVIDDVSSQTNLLALNAAIISAQAGEHGKEFSVVADEIRDLAEKAAVSTQEIAHLIKGVQQEAIKAVNTMEEGARLVASGVILSHRAGDVLKMITRSSTESSKMTHQIEEATIEQVHRSGEISEIVDRLKIMSDQIAKATREQKVGISQIMREAENMREMAQQVRNATDKQANESRSISNTVSDAKELVERIRIATTEQKTESQSILEAVAVFNEITNKNVESMVEMDRAVDSLSAQVRSLESQVSRFRV